LAFDSAGNLYDSYGPAGTIGRFSLTGTGLGIFASGLLNPVGVAFDSAGNLYATNFTSSNGYIEKLTPGGAGSVFATGLSWPVFVAIQVPEPSTWAVLVLGLPALFACLRTRQSA
jgi:DNA-binding beta-propeller fold protein YncE